MTHGSLFSGIGGFDLAAQWMGWDNIFSCEINPFGQRVLQYYWPNAIHYSDINETDFTIHRRGIDVLTGGFPCQPFSLAGKRKGTDDDRHLWPRMLEVIRQVQPVWVVGENVYGIINWDGGVVFDQVQSDLESEGYEVQPVILPACAVNAPHRRDRVWFIAHSNKERRGRGERLYKQQQKGAVKFSEVCDKRKSGTSADTPGKRREEWKQLRQRESNKGFERSGSMGDVTDTSDKRLERGEINGVPGGKRKERNEQFAGLFCTDWQDFPTQSPLCSRNDGLPSRLSGITFSKHRNESIKAYGNAIVPQIAYEIFKVIQKMSL
jgi:DNA (cytosine-5)-methyltransferase 1